MKLIGDPTLLGWTITIALAIAAALSWAASRARASDRPQRVLWLALACGVGILAANKQLDLQMTLDGVGRPLVKRLGWYGHRELIQVAFLLCLGVGVGSALLLLARVTRPWSPSQKVALFGASILALHLVVRAASFDVYDVRKLVGGWNFYPLLELSGSAFVAAGAWRALGARARSAPSGESPAPGP